MGVLGGSSIGPHDGLSDSYTDLIAVVFFRAGQPAIPERISIYEVQAKKKKASSLLPVIFDHLPVLGNDEMVMRKHYPEYRHICIIHLFKSFATKQISIDFRRKFEDFPSIAHLPYIYIPIILL